MKKLNKLFICLTYIMLLASCDGNSNLGKEVKISKKQATEEIQNATREMKNSAGFRMQETSSLQFAVNENLERIYNKLKKENLTAKNTLLNLKESSLLEFKATDDEKALLESTIDLSLNDENLNDEDETVAHTYSFNGLAGFYIKENGLYSKIQAKTISDKEEQNIDKTDYQLLDDLVKQIEEESKDVLPEIPEHNPVIEEKIKNFLIEYEDSLPAPKAYEKDNDLTIVYALTTEDLKNSSTLITTFISELTQRFEKNDIQKFIDNNISLNKCELQIKIHDGTMITNIGYDLDFELKNLFLEGDFIYDNATFESLGMEKTYLSFGLKAAGNFDFEMLDSTYTIAFPADMSKDWHKEQEEETSL